MFDSRFQQMATVFPYSEVNGKMMSSKLAAFGVRLARVRVNRREAASSLPLTFET